MNQETVSNNQVPEDNTALKMAFRGARSRIITIPNLKVAARQAMGAGTSYSLNRLFEQTDFPGNAEHLAAFSDIFWNLVNGNARGACNHSTASTFLTHHINGPRHNDIMAMLHHPEGTKSYWTLAYDSAFKVLNTEKKQRLLYAITECYLLGRPIREEKAQKKSARELPTSEKIRLTLALRQMTYAEDHTMHHFVERHFGLLALARFKSALASNSLARGQDPNSDTTAAAPTLAPAPAPAAPGMPK